MSGATMADRRDVAMEILRQKEDQMHALAVSPVIRLEPRDEEGDRVAYHLAAILQDMLGDAAMRNAVEAVLFAPSLGAGSAS